MKTLAVLFVSVVAVVLLLAYARYETIAPCGMFRAEAKRAILREAKKDSGGDTIGDAIVSAVGVPIIDLLLKGHTASLTPLECMNELIRLHKDGDVSGLLESQQ
jgi:hypothetical protein